MKENTVIKIKKCIIDNIFGITAGMLIGLGIGTALGFGANYKISKTLSPAKKGAIIALGTLGDMMTQISENLK